MSDTRDMTPGDRRELRSLVKKQFAVLRNDVKRREKELEGEIEAELLRQYRAQDEAIARAHDAATQAHGEYVARLQEIARELKMDRPELETDVVSGYRGTSISASDPNRAQTRRAALGAIPQRIAHANTKLDQEELELLRDLTIGALDSNQAQQFLNKIPTVGVLVPSARLAEIEGGAS